MSKCTPIHHRRGAPVGFPACHEQGSLAVRWEGEEEATELGLHLHSKEAVENWTGEQRAKKPNVSTANYEICVLAETQNSKKRLSQLNNLKECLRNQWQSRPQLKR